MAMNRFHSLYPSRDEPYNCQVAGRKSQRLPRTDSNIAEEAYRQALVASAQASCERLLLLIF